MIDYTCNLPQAFFFFSDSNFLQKWVEKMLNIFIYNLGFTQFQSWNLFGVSEFVVATKCGDAKYSENYGFLKIAL